MTRPAGKITVIHITQASGGVQTYLYSFVKAMDRKLFRNILISPPDESIHKNAEGVFDEVIGVEMRREICPVSDLISILRVFRLLRNFRSAVVHIHSSKAGLIGRVAASLARNKTIVFTPHGFSYLSYSGLLRWVALLWERLAQRLFPSFLLATSPSEARRGIEEIGFPTKKTKIVYNGLQIAGPSRSDKSKPLRSPYVLTIARFIPVKNPMMLLRIAKLFKETGRRIHFYLIGRGYHDSLSTKMNSFIELHRLQNHLTIMPWMEHSDVLFYIRNCALYLSTSRSECFGYAVAESMMFGKPVVGTNIDGTRDLVDDGKTGFLVDIDDDSAAAFRIQQILEDKSLAARLGNEAKARASELLDVKTNVRHLESCYRTLVNKM